VQNREQLWRQVKTFFFSFSCFCGRFGDRNIGSGQPCDVVWMGVRGVDNIAISPRSHKLAKLTTPKDNVQIGLRSDDIKK
jgi:hypothetical protein